MTEEPADERQRVASPDVAPVAAFGFGLSQRDEIIKQLNHQGLSHRGISKALLDYGIELSETSVRRHLTDLNQDPDNKIQVNFKATYRKPPSERRWYNIILRLQKMIPEYEKRMGYKPSARTEFYELQDLGLVKPEEESAYNRAIVHARLRYIGFDGQLEYPVLPLDCFAADTSRLTINNYDDRPPQRMIPPGDIPDPDEHVNGAIVLLRGTIAAYDGVGESGLDAKPGGYWYGQPKYVEVWEEKNDLLEGFEDILKKRYIKIRANKGWSSLDFLRQCTLELKDLIETKKLDINRIHVGYNGDCDPSGMEMDYYVRKRLKQLGIDGIHFERIAVTPQQIVQYRLPLMSLKRPSGKKADDPNLKEFNRLHGNNATHLNAFFTQKHIKDFKKILLGWVDNHHDKKIYRDMLKSYNTKADPPPGLSEETLKRVRKLMRKKVTAAFPAGWEREAEKQDEDEDEYGDDNGDDNDTSG
jgi:hypothetical protein